MLLAHCYLLGLDTLTLPPGSMWLLQEVPFDPELPYLFMGEELLYSARLWTHGW